jgi:hypothetical protein
MTSEWERMERATAARREREDREAERDIVALVLLCAAVLLAFAVFGCS